MSGPSDRIWAYRKRHSGRIVTESTIPRFNLGDRVSLQVADASLVGEGLAEPRRIQPPEMGSDVALPQVGGLHHRYDGRVACGPFSLM